MNNEEMINLLKEALDQYKVIDDMYDYHCDNPLVDAVVIIIKELEEREQ